jgi:hypothetical protein
MSEPPTRSSSPLVQATAAGSFSFHEAIGGRRGLLESVVPGAVFVVVFTVTRSLTWSVAAAFGAAGAFVVARLARRDTVQHALGGLVGIAVCAFIAQRSGRAVNFYLPGLWINVGYAAAYLVSILVRWPLLGVIIGFLRGEGTTWRRDPAQLRAYSLASWIWVGVFVARLVVQYPLYQADAVVALGVARVAMGLPLFVLAAYLSWLILRRRGPSDRSGG